jgi:predicted nucleotidyltransferase
MVSFQEQVLAKLLPVLQQESNILALFEGGSVATGNADALSDIDIQLICEDHAVNRTFQLLQHYLDQTYELEKAFRVPEPTYHGHAQSFYFLKSFPPLIYMDVVVQKRNTNASRILETDRHGKAKIWFDKEGLVVLQPSEPKWISNRVHHAYHQCAYARYILDVEFKKAIQRGLPIEAQEVYRSVLMRLAVLLNIKFRPAQFDFGFRYAHRVYPTAVVNQVEHLLTSHDQEMIITSFNTALEWYDDLLNELHDTV